MKDVLDVRAAALQLCDGCDKTPLDGVVLSAAGKFNERRVGLFEELGQARTDEIRDQISALLKVGVVWRACCIPQESRIAHGLARVSVRDA
jgi:hypothetical protein